MVESKRAELSQSDHGPKPSITRELVELAALFLAVGMADLFANTLAHNRTGPYVLFGLGFLLIACAALHRWWRHRPHPRAAPSRPAAEEVDEPATHGPPELRIWRVRTTVRDTPGRLAALSASLAAYRINIVSVQVSPVPDGVVDEFLLQAPAEVTAADIAAALEAGGGLDPRAERADVHDLVDVPTRMLMLAADAVSAGPELPGVLRALLGDCMISWEPAGGSRPTRDGSVDHSTEGVDGTVLRLLDPEGGRLVLERPSFPFTPAEFARAHAVLELDRRLAARLGAQRTALPLPSGAALSVRQGLRSDAERVLALHDRCSAASRRRRYLGGDPPTPSTLERLLSRRHGHALVVESPSGEVIALANLLWDGDVAEVALLVEDAWQGKGIGSALLRRLIDIAWAAGTESVYAVTSATNSQLIRMMRRVGAELDGIESGLACLTIRPQDTKSRPVAPAERPC